MKIYSNQNVPNATPLIDSLLTNDMVWWMIYDANTLEIILPPKQCSGGTFSPFTMVISDTREELEQYIQDNGLILPLDQYDSFLIYNIE